MKVSRKILLLAIVVAFATTVGIYKYIHSIEDTMASTKLIGVWVAKETIPANARIQNSMLKKEQMASEYVLSNAVFDEQKIIGKYAAERILQGEQILGDRLVELEKTQFSYRIPKGKRAVTIKVDDTAGVADLIKPGDFVDVLVYIDTIEIEEKDKKTVFPNIVKVVLQNIQVLAINQEHGQVEKQNEVQKNEDDEKNERQLTLAVTPIDSEKLVLGDTVGKIRLALRHPEEKQIQDTPAAIIDDIVPGKGKMILSK